MTCFFFFFFIELSSHRLESHRPLQPQVAREHSDSTASIMLNTGRSLKDCYIKDLQFYFRSISTDMPRI